MMPTVFDCSVIKLPQIKYRSGNITPITNGIELPFSVKRVFYIYDIPGGEDRGAHAHKECHQFIVAVSGSFEIELNDGKIKRSILLNRPYFGLHILPGIWAAEKNFCSGAVCLVLTSHKYDDNDYIRKYKEYLNYRMLDKSIAR